MRSDTWVNKLSLNYVIVIMAFMGLPPAVSAISPDLGIECEECRYSWAVKLPACSGVYMGNGLVITAASCTDTTSPGDLVHFGEDANNPAYSFAVESCERHPDAQFEGTWYGPNIAYCLLEEAAVEALDFMWTVPPMIPQGCERDWLAHQTYKTSQKTLVTAVGLGCETDMHNCNEGVKRFVGQQLIQQMSLFASDTKLQLRRDNIWGDIDTGIRLHDEGGPVFVKMPVPDNTWRLIGVLTHKNESIHAAYAEAVPPYLHWIESASGVDITPYHFYLNGTWYTIDNVAALLPRYVDDPVSWGTWNYACAPPPAGMSDTYTEVKNFSGCTFESDIDDFAPNPDQNPPRRSYSFEKDSFTYEKEDAYLTSPLSFLPIADSEKARSFSSTKTK